MKKGFKIISITSIFLSVSVYLILFFMPSPSLLSGYTFSKAVYDDQHQLLRLTLSNDQKYRLFTTLNKIPKQLIDTTLLQEDQYFHWHNGLNPLALFKAVWHTYIVQSR